MIRPAIFADLDVIDDIAKRAIDDMFQSKIPQWDHTYPRKPHYYNDIVHGDLYVHEIDGRIVAMMTLRPEDDPPYQSITGWSTPHGQSIVIHRVIVDPNNRRQGLFQSFLSFAKATAQERGFHSIKIDTHTENYKMRRFLEKHGFQYIGYLDVIDREAYELTWEEPI